VLGPAHSHLGIARPEASSLPKGIHRGLPRLPSPESPRTCAGRRPQEEGWTACDLADCHSGGTIVHALGALVLSAMSASFDTVTDPATTHTSSAGAGRTRPAPHTGSAEAWTPTSSRAGAGRVRRWLSGCLREFVQQPGYRHDQLHTIIANRNTAGGDLSKRPNTKRRPRRGDRGDRTSWVALSCHQLNLSGRDRDTIEIGNREGWFRAARPGAEGNDVEVLNMEIIYDNGAPDELDVRRVIRDGDRTAAYDLKGTATNHPADRPGVSRAQRGSGPSQDLRGRPACSVRLRKGRPSRRVAAHNSRVNATLLEAPPARLSLCGYSLTWRKGLAPG
jgi:hypothetical protein